MHTQHAHIQAAIGSHGTWKKRLHESIESGKSHLPVSTIQSDNSCEFGKWLHGPSLDAKSKASADYLKCKDLHREFHLEAAHVTSLALAGKKDEAMKAMAPGSKFASVSASLTFAMMNWIKTS